MTTQVQYRRGSAAENNAFTGALGEITVDTTAKTLRVHDGATAGGSNIATASYVDSSIAAISTTSIQNGTSNVSVISSGGNVTTTVGGSAIVTVHSDGIDNELANGVGNIGTATSYFNTVFAKATSAQYADLAEKYESDAVYEPGTVIVIGGSKEVTQCSRYADSSVVGVVSTNPAYIMNAGISAEVSIELALTGRVPCRVVGQIQRGDCLTTSEIPGVAVKLLSDSFVPGCILGKALEDYNSDQVGVIEVLVGKS